MTRRRRRWTVWWLAALAFLAPLKFGTPVIVQQAVPPPSNGWEWLFFLWPNPLLVILAFGALIWVVPDFIRQRGPLFWLPALFLATQFAAWPGSVHRQVSTDTVMLLAVCGLAFYATAWCVRDEASFVRVAGGLGGATLVICVVALRQYFTGFAETATMLPEFPGAAPAVAAKLAARRVFGTLVSPNALAGFLVVAAGPTLAWIWHRARSWRAEIKWLALALATGLMLGCLVLTGSRGGLMALGVAVVAVVVCRQSRRMLLLAGLGIAVVAVAAQVSGRARWGGESVAARWDYWQGAARIIRDHPWRGTGPGTFGSVYPMYKTATTEEAQTVHNNFLQMWSDSGVVAFVVFAALWSVALRDAYRRLRQRPDPVALALASSLTGWVAHGLVDFDLYAPGVALPAFILLGAVQGLNEPAAEPRGKSRWWTTILGAAVVTAVVWAEGRALAAVFPYGRAREFGDLVAADEAAWLQPANSHYWATAGDCAMAAGRLDRAVNDYRTAAANDPYRAAYPWRLARALWAVGRRDEAVAELQRAVALNPTHAEYRRDLAAATAARAAPAAAPPAP